MNVPCKRGRAIGLTGGIACGKSTVLRILEHQGLQVLDTDQVAHEVMQTGSDVFALVVETFGQDILDEEKEIDRKKLGAIVFNDGSALKKLNEIVHPAVGTIWRNWLEAHVAEGRNVVIAIPLLFEVGAVDGWDAIVTVAADHERVVERLADRGFDRDGAEARIGAQWPIEKKVAGADYVIRNNGSLEDLNVETLKVLEHILSK